MITTYWLLPSVTAKLVDNRGGVGFYLSLEAV